MSHTEIQNNQNDMQIETRLEKVIKLTTSVTNKSKANK